MFRLFIVLSVSMLASPSRAEEFVLTTTDGVSVYGDFHSAGSDMTAPVILLFHQGGGDARGEYGPIVGRLNDGGYHVLKIDQRRGGDVFGGVNRTVKELGDEEYGYCDAYPDLEAALGKISDLGLEGPVTAWGSSYSAALVFQLAARHSARIDAVLAFSPASGGPLADCAPQQFSGDLDIPVLVLRPASEMSVPSVPPQMEQFRSEGHQTFVADPGVHGSSMLVADRVDGDTEKTWSAVLDFLSDALGQ